MAATHGHRGLLIAQGRELLSPSLGLDGSECPERRLGMVHADDGPNMACKGTHKMALGSEGDKFGAGKGTMFTSCLEIDSFPIGAMETECQRGGLSPLQQQAAPFKQDGALPCRELQGIEQVRG